MTIVYRVIQKTTDKIQQWVKNVYIRKNVNTKLSENAIQKSYGHFSEVSTFPFCNAARIKALEHPVVASRVKEKCAGKRDVTT